MTTDHNVPPIPGSSGLRLALSEAVRARPMLALGALALEPMSGAMNAGVALALKLVMDAAVDGDLGRSATFAAVGGVAFAMVIVGGGLGFTLRRTLSEQVTHRFDGHLIGLASSSPTIEHFERPDYLDRMDLLLRDSRGMGDVVNALILGGAQIAVAIAPVALLISVHPLLSLVPVAGLVPFMVETLHSKRMKALEEATAQDHRLSTYLFGLATTPSAGVESRVYGLHHELLDRFDGARQRTRDARIRTDTKAARDRTLAGVLRVVLLTAAIAYSLALFTTDQATLGDVVLVITLGQRAAISLTTAGATYGFIASQLRTVERFVWLRNHTADAVAARAGTTAPPAHLVHGIVLDGVGFRYPGTETTVLSDISITLPTGAVVAIVGDNGAGKTTLAKLLAGFYTPTAGRVLVDGTDLSEVDPKRWHAAITATHQDFVRYEVTVGEAIGVGHLPNIEDENRVLDAARTGGVDEFLEHLPNGLAQQLGRQWPGGVDLSTGQWQKLAVARGWMRSQVPLRLLDEPASALDPASEQQLTRNLLGFARSSDQTVGLTVLVTHRLAAVRAADLILVIHNGEVVEAGSHDELMSCEGAYARRFATQASSYSTGK